MTIRKHLSVVAILAVVALPITGVAAAHATTEETPWPATSTVTTPGTPSSTATSDPAPAGTEPAGTSPTPTPTAGGSPAGATSSESSTTGLPSSPSTSPSPDRECTVAERGRVHAERVGPASFRIWTDGDLACGVWVSTFAFDDGYQPTDRLDYRHPQTAVDWAFAQVTSTPAVHGVPVPACGPFQSDVYVGPLVLALPDGELGDRWRAGDIVIDNPACQEAPPSTPTPTPTTPGPTPPTTSSPTSTPTPIPKPSTPPAPTPTTPPVATPSPTPAPSSTASTSPPSAPAGSGPAPSPKPSTSTAPSPLRATQARTAPTPDADALAYTGSDLRGWAITTGIGLVLLVAGIVVVARNYRRKGRRS